VRGIGFLSRQAKGKDKEESDKQKLFHRLTPRSDLEPTEDNKEFEAESRGQGSVNEKIRAQNGR
jgi:hypothetical protein